MCRRRQVRDGGAYGCAVPRAYANLNPGLLTPRSHSHRWLLHFRNTSWLRSVFPSLVRFGRMTRPLWLNTRSTGADVAGTDKTFSSSGCNIWIVASAFSWNHGSSIGTDDFPALLPVPDTPSNYLPSPPWDFRSLESVQPCTCSYIDTTLNNSTTKWAH